MAIKSFVHRGLDDIFRTGTSRKVGAEYRKRLKLILDALDAATCVGDLQGARGFLALPGDRAGSLAMHVSGNWRLTFHFENGDEGDITDVDFEDYH